MEQIAYLKLFYLPKALEKGVALLILWIHQYHVILIESKYFTVVVGRCVYSRPGRRIRCISGATIAQLYNFEIRCTCTGDVVTVSMSGASATTCTQIHHHYYATIFYLSIILPPDCIERLGFCDEHLPRVVADMVYGAYSEHRHHGVQR